MGRIIYSEGAILTERGLTDARRFIADPRTLPSSTLEEIDRENEEAYT